MYLCYLCCVKILHQLDPPRLHMYFARHLPHHPQLQNLQRHQVYLTISVNCEIMKLCLRLSHMRSRTSVKKEINLASILVCIVFVFLFCNIPRVFINCYEFLSSEEVIR